MKLVTVFLLAILLTILFMGLYKPWLVLWFVDVKTRMKVISFFLPPTIILLIFYIFLNYSV